MTGIVTGASALLAVLLGTAGAVMAADTVRYAVGPAGNWDTLVVDMGVKAGIFERHGIRIEPFYTEGGGQTLQAVIAGSVDIGSAVGTLGVFAAFAKGAPVRIVGAQATGAADFWYVKSDSPIKSMRDLQGGHTIGYSTAGASTEIFALNFIDVYDLDAKTVATGSPISTLTQVMTGQVDVGWSSPPIGLAQAERGDIRIIAHANDLERTRGQTIRVLVAGASFVDDKPEVVDQFIRAYAETVDWLYAGDAPLAQYAEITQTDPETAAKVRSAFDPSIIDPYNFSGLDLLQEDLVKFRFLPAALTGEQIEELMKIPARP